MTREQWLLATTKKLEERYFSRSPRILPKKLAVSCGIPKGSNRAIGQCWDPRVSKDGTTHIFICPSLDDPFEILSTLLHELVHACVGLAEGHGGEFARVARKVGLKGKLTATFVEPGSDTGNFFQEIVKEVGEYPHKGMLKTGTKKKKEKEKYVRLVSLTEEGYTFSIKEMLLENGYPKDPWGREMVELKGKNDA